MIGQLIALFAAGEAAGLRQRLKTAAIAYCAIVIGAFLALSFLLLAAYLAAATRWGAVMAAFWFGIGFLLLSVIVYAAYRMVASAQRRAERQKRTDTGIAAGAAAMAMLPAVFGRKSGRIGLLLTLASVAGFAAYRELVRTGKDRG